MDFLIYGRSALDGHDDTPGLDDEHWTYMDAFADRMTARGPTLSADRQTWTGSLHVVDLADVEAARAFARDDPYHRAGLFGELLIRTFDNRLGRAMSDFAPGAGDVPFLVLAGSDEDGPLPVTAGAAPSSGVVERLIVWGTLRTVGAQRPTGTALAVAAPDLDAVRSLIADEPAVLEGHAQVEIHAWEFGGRR